MMARSFENQNVTSFCVNSMSKVCVRRGDLVVNARSASRKKSLGLSMLMEVSEPNGTITLGNVLGHAKVTILHVMSAVNDWVQSYREQTSQN